jgi:hypothetical protein
MDAIVVGRGDGSGHCCQCGVSSVSGSVRADMRAARRTDHAHRARSRQPGRAPLICEISYRDARVSPDFNCLCSS